MIIIIVIIIITVITTIIIIIIIIISSSSNNIVIIVNITISIISFVSNSSKSDWLIVWLLCPHLNKS